MFIADENKYEPVKVGSLSIPIYGYFLQQEQAAFEDAIAEYNDAIREIEKVGDTDSEKIARLRHIAKDTVLTNKIVSMFLRSRVAPVWTCEAVQDNIPWTYVAIIYDLLNRERKADDLKKKYEAMIEAIYPTDLAEPIGES